MIDIIEEMIRVGIFDKAIRSGLVSISFKRYYKIYKYYIDKRTKSSKMCSIVATSEEFNISERSVYLIIDKMKKAD